MTIIKAKPTEKKPETEVPLAEVVYDDLAEKKGAESDVEVPMTLITVNRRRRFNICACIFVLTILIMAAVGGVLLYKHFAHRNRTLGRCGVSFYAEQWERINRHQGRHDALKDGTTPGLDINTNAPELIDLEEEIEVDVDKQVETFHIPRIGPYRPIQVVYDFEKNLSAILDKDQMACFVKPLNRSLVKPPKSMLDFLLKLSSNYYMSRSRVSRQDWYIDYPAIENVEKLGVFIYEMCHEYPTFRLRKIEPLPTPLPMQEGSDSTSDDSDDLDDDFEDGRRGHHGRRGKHGRHGHHGHHGHHHGPGMDDNDMGRHGMRNKREAANPVCYPVISGADADAGLVEKTCIFQ